MDKEFLAKLKATFDALVSQNEALKERITALEHSVNDVIIGGLTAAADEYEDNERFSEFVDTYSESYSPYGDTCKIIYGDDYDIAEELYAGSKDKEDVKSYVESEIASLQSKLDALKEATKETEDNTVEEEEEEEKEFDEDELSRIAKELL
jgi:hypothetical protein